MKILALQVLFWLTFITVVPVQVMTGNSIPSIQKDEFPSRSLSDEVKTQATGSAWYKDENMPWMIALIISIAGIIINLLIANKQIKANLNNINANNRQAWVTDTRNVIASLITQVNLLNIEFRESVTYSDRKKDLHEKLTYNKNKLLLLLNPGNKKHKKLMDALDALMMNLDGDLRKGSLTERKEKHTPVDHRLFISQTEAVIESGRNLLYDEWGKIQSA